jgi:hypothetical protein
MALDVKLFDDLDAVAADANGALDRARQPALFDRLDWYRLLHRHCPPPGKLLALRAADDWLFLSVEGRAARAYANWYTLRFAGGAHVATARALRQLGLARVELAPLDCTAAAKAAFREAGWLTDVSHADVAWKANTAGLSFDDYWARRPGKLRSTAARKAKAAELETSIYNHFDAEAWNDYEAVYAASWKPEEGSPAFLRALAQQEGASGTLRLGMARKDGRPLAAQFWLVENGTATIHKLAYVEAAKALSPGTILSVAMFRHAIDVDRVALIDFGLGDDAYKADWMDRCEPVERLIAHNPRTVAGLLGAARTKASALVRRVRSH